MRGIEPGLNSLAAKLGIPVDRANWSNILDQIDKAVRSIGTANPPSSGWKDDQQYCSEAAVHLRLIKDAWRNHAMHLRDKYDEERAEAVFINVRGLMKHLSIRLSDPEATPGVQSS